MVLGHRFAVLNDLALSDVRLTVDDMFIDRSIVDTYGVTVTDVSCRDEPARWSRPEPVTRRTVVLIRSGLFRRRVGSHEVVLDSSGGYLPAPGTEESFAHPVGDDRCTSIAVSEDEFDALLGSRVRPEVITTTPRLDVAHRALIAGHGPAQHRMSSLSGPTYWSAQRWTRITHGAPRQRDAPWTGYANCWPPTAAQHWMILRGRRSFRRSTSAGSSGRRPGRRSPAIGSSCGCGLPLINSRTAVPILLRSRPRTGSPIRRI